MRVAPLIALPALAAVLLACGGGGGDGEAAMRTETAGAATATAEAEATAAPAQRRAVGLQRIGNFSSPVYVAAPPGDTRRLFVVEQGGRIWVLRGGRRLSRPFLDISGKTEGGGERGLLGLAFAPDYARSGRFYVDYTDNSGDTRIEEYRRATPDRAGTGARLVLGRAHPEPNHNGGQLAFGPDGLLYVGLGDGGGGGDQHGTRGNAQNLGTLLGKILRVDPRRAGGRRYTIPRSNPFVGRRGARGEIYAYGLRNPWRFAFDRATGDLAIGDVGQNAVEEVDFVRRGRGRGANFGWRVFEGTSRYAPGERAPGHVPPVIQRTHRQGWCSVTGGYVVRDRSLPGLYGRYVFGDYCEGRLLSAGLHVPRARDVRSTGLRVNSLSSFGEDARGRVYATSLSGSVYRLVAR